MRACVFALAITAVAQPAFAREHHKSHHASHHYSAQGRHHVARLHHHARVALAPREAIISGYAMPQSFARTDSVESAWSASQSWAPSAPQVTTSGWVSEDVRLRGRATDGALDGMIARHAAANGVPVELVRRVVKRESGGNPRASNRGALGLMQIKHATARSMGYSGPASGLFDAETNLTYAVRYLAGAYKAAGGNQSRAVALYASGYYGRGVTVARRAPSEMVAQATPVSTLRSDSVAPVMMQSDVMARRHMRRHRAY
jgi:soluble lytic murein transglycosylase-like protein